MSDGKPPPLPMPALISVAEEARLKAAGEWPPPPRPVSPRHTLRQAERTPPDGGQGKPVPREELERRLAEFYERLRRPPPWEVERTARKEAEAAAKADKED